MDKVDEFIERRVTWKPARRYAIPLTYRRSLGYRMAIQDFLDGREFDNPFKAGSTEAARYDVGRIEAEKVRERSGA